MSRIVNRPVKVILRHDEPSIVVDGNNSHNVTEIIDSWDEGGAWWENEQNKHVYRIMTDTFAIMDLDQTGDEWRIYKILD